jgi:hypothetical protein
MKKILMLFVLVAINAIPTVADASPDRKAGIDFRIVATPKFSDGPAGLCAFTGKVPIVTEDDEWLGKSILCVESFEERLGPPYRFIEHGHETLKFADGTLLLGITFVDTYNADFSAAAHDATGTVRSGTGRYTGASGSMTGHGVILFDTDGTPHPHLTYHIKLSAREGEKSDA